MSIEKFNQRVDRLAEKIKMSKTPVPGLLVGLSGTDSIVAFILCYHALSKLGMANKLVGLHCDRNHGWFAKHIIEWLQDLCPDAYIFVDPDEKHDDDNHRWYALREYAYATGHWLVACVNATERQLGTYSIQAKSASLWPIATLWKTDIMAICEEFKVPKIAIDKARIPDCACGRDELAAENIELIDQIIQFRVDPTQHDPELLKKLIEYVRDTKNQYDFKDRTPYII